MVDRYSEGNESKDGTIYMGVSQSGKWVRYADYAALLADNERLKAEWVDLGKFRDLIGFACLRAISLTETDPSRDYIRQCSELMSLIDAHKGE